MKTYRIQYSIKGVKSLRPMFINLDIDVENETTSEIREKAYQKIKSRSIFGHKVQSIKDVNIHLKNL